MFQDVFVGARKWFLEGRHSSPRQGDRDRDHRYSGEGRAPMLVIRHMPASLEIV
jgi:hypothetical protein